MDNQENKDKSQQKDKEREIGLMAGSSLIGTASAITTDKLMAQTDSPHDNTEPSIGATTIVTQSGETTDTVVIEEPTATEQQTTIEVVENTTNDQQAMVEVVENTPTEQQTTVVVDDTIPAEQHETVIIEETTPEEQDEIVLVDPEPEDQIDVEIEEFETVYGGPEYFDEPTDIDVEADIYGGPVDDIYDPLDDPTVDPLDDVNPLSDLIDSSITDI